MWSIQGMIYKNQHDLVPTKLGTFWLGTEETKLGRQKNKPDSIDIFKYFMDAECENKTKFVSRVACSLQVRPTGSGGESTLIVKRFGTCLIVSDHPTAKSKKPNQKMLEVGETYELSDGDFVWVQNFVCIEVKRVRLSLCRSSLSTKERELFDRYCRELEVLTLSKVEVQNVVSQSTSYLVTSDAPNKVSSSLLEALAGGIPIVKISFLLDSAVQIRKHLAAIDMSSSATPVANYIPSSHKLREVIVSRLARAIAVCIVIAPCTTWLREVVRGAGFGWYEEDC